MDDLLRRCTFHKEWEAFLNNTSIDSELLAQMATSGSASVDTFRLPDGQTVQSYAVKERHQFDTHHLPIGARTLLLSTSSATTGNRIVLRGLNKFPAIDEVGLDCVLGAMGCEGVNVLLQRKMAGFIVHVFSTNGATIEVLSKHSLDGPHACHGKKLLQAALGDDPVRIVRLAQRLFAANAVLSGEVVDKEFDKFHPILDDDVDNGIVFFALQDRSSAAELSRTTASLISLTSEFGLKAVQALPVEAPHRWPTAALGTTSSTNEENVDGRTFIERCQSWDCRPFGSPHGGEGFVLLLEIPLHSAVKALFGEKPVPRQEQDLVVAIRVKIKTTRYELVRQVRSVVLGEFHGSGIAGCGLLPAVVLHWALGNEIRRPFLNPKLLKDEVQRAGIHELMMSFARSVDGGQAAVDRVGHRSIDLLYPKNHVFMLLSGLPGSGKTTMVEHLVNCGQALKGCQVIVISRDEIQARLMAAAMESNPNSDALSGHQVRRIRKEVHAQTVAALSHAISLDQTKPTVVILDACNADSNARHQWLSIVPVSFHVVLVDARCDVSTAASRAQLRDDHLTLAAADAQQAVYKINEKLKHVTLDEAKRFFGTRQLVTIDTATSSITECSSQLDSALRRVPIHWPMVGDVRRLTLDVMRAQHLEVLGTACRELGLSTPQLGASAAVGRTDTNWLAELLRMEESDDGSRNKFHKNRRATVVSICPVGDDGMALWKQLADGCLCGLVKQLLPENQQPANTSTSQPPSSSSITGTAATLAKGAWKAVASWIPKLGSRDTGSPTDAAPAGHPNLRLTAGATNWLKGILAYGLRLPHNSASLTPEAMLQELQQRYQIGASPLHVTLAHHNDFPKGFDLKAFVMQKLHISAQREERVLVEFSVTAILVDTKGVCFEVSRFRIPGPGSPWLNGPFTGEGDASKQALHLTLGTVDGTPPHYCATMQRSFEEWVKENEQRDAIRKDRKRPRESTEAEERPLATQDVGTRKLKLHNFARFELTSEVLLTGTLSFM